MYKSFMDSAIDKGLWRMQCKYILYKNLALQKQGSESPFTVISVLLLINSGPIVEDFVKNISYLAFWDPSWPNGVSV